MYLLVTRSADRDKIRPDVLMTKTLIRYVMNLKTSPSPFFRSSAAYTLEVIYLLPFLLLCFPLRRQYIFLVFFRPHPITFLHNLIRSQISQIISS